LAIEQLAALRICRPILVVEDLSPELIVRAGPKPVLPGGRDGMRTSAVLLA